jgi:DNA-binding YbaB/EbfC family protein
LCPGSSTTTIPAAGGLADDVALVLGAGGGVLDGDDVVTGATGTEGDVAGAAWPSGWQPASSMDVAITERTARLRTATTVPHRGRLVWKTRAFSAERIFSIMVQPGGGFDMQAILQQAQQMQQQLASAQDELANTEVTGTSGGGLVTATVTGAMELTNLVIDPKVVDPEDVETLADLVVAAVRDASANAQKLTEQKLGPLAGGLGGGMPDLGGLGGLGLPGA